MKKIAILSAVFLVLSTALFAATVSPDVIVTAEEVTIPESTISFNYDDRDNTFMSYVDLFNLYGETIGFDISNAVYSLVSEEGESPVYNVQITLPDEKIVELARVIALVNSLLTELMHVNDLQILPSTDAESVVIETIAK